MRHVKAVVRGAAALSIATLAWGIPTAEADPGADPASKWSALERFLDNDYYKISLDVRARIELADFEEDLESSQAYTIRTRAGVGSKPLYGLSAYAELQNTLAIKPSEYFDTVEPPTGQSPIADPEETDLNQLFARYQNSDLLGADVVFGRQRVTLDDQRFIGNVGWRQNEQVYDAVRASTSLGIEHFNLLYGYIDYVQRIFGNQGPPATRDFHSDSHLVHVGYDAWSAARLALFAYLLDFDNSPVNSSNSYGFRVTGSQALSEEWTLGYAGSYAVQTDAANNPVDYVAHYVAAEGGVAYRGTGGVAVGYELLGSDDGKARFVTPLATGHKFNGWADAFLDNGGPNGLQDLYASVTPELPFGLKSIFVYHYFWSDEGGDALGYELDAQVLRKLGSYVTVLTKFAYFDGRVETLSDRWRYWLEVTFQY
jgi:hypothetical protein